MKKLTLIAAFLAFVGVTNAQKIIEPKFTFNVELGLPSSTANQLFKTAMQGLVTTNVYGQYSFPFHLNVGLGAKYSLFSVNEFELASPIHGSYNSIGGFAKVGYDKFYNERFAMDYGVKVGYLETLIFTDQNKAAGNNPVQFGAVFFEPTIGLILTADERNSYRLNVGYTVVGDGFRPDDIGMEDDGGFDPDNFGVLTQSFFIGFGYTFYFGIKPSS